MKRIDLRSDTVTTPTPEMREAMAQADVGDDVYGEDPTVNRLESIAAETMGTEAAIFVSSGTQSNLLALLSHCQRGDEYISGYQAHTYKYEGGGAAVLGGIQPHPLEFDEDGSLDLNKVMVAIRPDDPHFARTRLLCLENTHNGKPLPMEYLSKADEFAKSWNLNLHLDGARLFNAVTAHNVPVQQITKHFDSISVCLSKGLCAPVGSVLCGSKDFIKQARRWRKVVGGGMRQAGVLAAAGIISLQKQTQRLREDHNNAARLVTALSAIEQLTVLDAQTNMIFIEVRSPEECRALAEFLQARGIITSPAKQSFRLVTHKDISAEDVDLVIEVFNSFFIGK